MTRFYRRCRPLHSRDVRAVKLEALTQFWEFAMRAAFALLFAATGAAAPVPKDFKPPPVVLTLSTGKSPYQEAEVVMVAIRNNGTEELKVTHAGIPSMPFGIEFRDEKDKKAPFDIPESRTQLLGVSTVTVLPGKTGTEMLALHPGYFTNGVWPAGKLTVVVRLKVGKKVYASEPLVFRE